MLALRRLKKALHSKLIAVRRSVGEPYLSVILVFFNLAGLFVFLAAVTAVSFCVLVRPEAAAAKYVADGLKLTVKPLAGLAAVLTIAQLLPGPGRWRDVRQWAGLVNLIIIWPLVFALALAIYIQLPAGADCA